MVAQTPVATRLSGCIGKIGWLDLLHWAWKGGNWSITAQTSPRWRQRSEIRGPGRFPLGEVSGERFPRAAGQAEATRF